MRFESSRMSLSRTWTGQYLKRQFDYVIMSHTPLVWNVYLEELAWHSRLPISLVPGKVHISSRYSLMFGYSLVVDRWLLYLPCKRSVVVVEWVSECPYRKGAQLEIIKIGNEILWMSRSSTMGAFRDFLEN
jgi:hypothetical protein